jgi:hypothetical protein
MRLVVVSWVSCLCILATWPASVESRSASSSIFNAAELTRIVGGVEVSISFFEY